MEGLPGLFVRSLSVLNQNGMAGKCFRGLLLLPVAWLYGCGVRVRHWLYDHGWLPVWRAPLPLVGVGNLSVGGTGKTPLTIAIVRGLQNRGVVPGVLSHGYRKRQRGVHYVEADSDPRDVGDEAFLLWWRTRAPTISGKDRRQAIALLCVRFPVQVIVADDLLQHRRVQPDVMLLAVRWGCFPWEDRLLPVGRLRDTLDALRRVDACMMTHVPPGLSREEVFKAVPKWWRQRFPWWLAERREGEPLPLPVYFREQMPDVPAEYSWEAIQGQVKRILLVAGIADATSWIAYWQQWCARRGCTLTVLRYRDHYWFGERDFRRWRQWLAADRFGKSLILCTEKDAVRLYVWRSWLWRQGMAPHIWVHPLDLVIREEDRFFSWLLERLQSGGMAERRNPCTKA